MRWLRRAVLLGVVGLAISVPQLQAGAPVGSYATPQIIDNDTVFDGNNIEMFVTNHGSFGWDLETGDPGTTFPKGAVNKTVIFASGLWMGARVNGQLRVTVGEYSQEYAAGPVVDGEPDSEIDADNRVYKINRGDNADNNVDYAEWPFADGAPADTSDPEYDPNDSATWKPRLFGDQTLWCVYNDLDESKHTNTAGNSNPLGVEVRQTVFGFDRQPPLGNMIFLKLEVENKGGNQLDSAYVSVWCDPDLGGFTDDLVGCDPELGLGYCYNATNNDELYGTAPPAVGYDFFQGPPNTYGTEFPDPENPGETYVPETLPMVSFNKYINGTDPATAQETYNYMRGLEINGDVQINPVTGEETTFYGSGDPVTGEGWLDDNPADRRLMLSAGPFEMSPGESAEIVVGIIVAQGADRLSSVQLLKNYDEGAQTVFDLGFALPSPPPQPTLYVRAYDEEIDLIWGTEADGDVQTSELGEEYHHEGFNVYQGESIAGPWKKIFTYDIDDSVGLIYNEVFDVGLGGLQTLIVQNGQNNGLTHQVRITDDKIRGGPLVNFDSYYYAITAYSYDANNAVPYFSGPNQIGHIAPMLENNPSSGAVEVMPKSSAGTLEVTADHVAGVSDGAVIVAYVNQSEILAHDYRVTFVANPDEESPDPFVWNLTDLTAGTTILSNMTNQSTDYDSPPVNGFVANVQGPPLALKDWDWETEAETGRWLSWVDWGGSGFNSGMGLGFEFFGESTLSPADYSKTVEIHFTSDDTQWSDCQTYRRDLGYVAGGIGQFPGTAWDVTGATPRQLNINFVENETGTKPANLLWDPDNSDDGGREYLFIMDSDYTGGVDYGDPPDLPDGTVADVLMAGWTRLRGDHPYLESDGVWTLVANRINAESDIFEFSTVPAGAGPGTVIDNDMAKIRVVPNPYFNQSAYELDQFTRVVRFVNMPAATATIRIFNLAGDLVRTIEKEDAEASWTSWDLQNEQAIPVASGIYIYHIEAEGIGTEVGKMAVFIEKERLNRF